MADHDVYDEYDALLEDPLFLDSDVNWDAIEGRQLFEDAAQRPEQGQSVSSDEYFSPADLEFDESFLDQVDRIEARANADASRERGLSSTFQGSSRMKKATHDNIETVIQTMLECPICCDLSAATHVLWCGHSACALCICRWLAKTTACFICRTPHYGPPRPNYMIDDMVNTYFDQITTTRNDEEQQSWQKRTSQGKAQVKSQFPRKPKRKQTRYIDIFEMIDIFDAST